uniref:Uncharacterized protein n=1 Tax=Rhizophagus irregularis (strain DAOM 181602 / DAOM 197198 / MUCL 43194) TaxID=747089 RepID=U9SJF9_RHIID
MTEKLVTPDECLDPNDEIRTIESLETTRIILEERITPIELRETFNSEATLRELYNGAHGKYVTLNETVKLKHLNKMSWLSTKPTSRNTLVTFYLAEDINPNFSKLTKIKNIVPDVGVVTADKIIEEQPYYNLEDFLEKHKHNKRQKLEES